MAFGMEAHTPHSLTALPLLLHQTGPFHTEQRYESGYGAYLSAIDNEIAGYYINTPDFIFQRASYYGDYDFQGPNYSAYGSTCTMGMHME